MKERNEEITEGLIKYYANKKGISYEEAEFELNNTFGYEEENELDESIFEISKYNTCPINPFLYDRNNISIFECA